MPKIYKISTEISTPIIGNIDSGSLTQGMDSGSDMYIDVPGYNAIYQNLLQITKKTNFPITNSGVKTTKEYIDLVFTGDTFITGNTINEILEYRGQHSMILEQNTYNGTSSYGIVPLPSFAVSTATKTFTGLTIESTGVNFEDGGSFTLPFEFTGNQSSISSNTIDFKFKIFKYESSLSGFSTSPVYSSDEFSYSSYTNYYSFTTGITKNSISTALFDGEYLIKGFYEYDSAHPISKELKLRHDNYDIITGSSLNIYQPVNDWYMVMLESVQKPTFTNISKASLDELLGTLVTTRQIVEFNGQTGFTISQGYLGNIFVIVNGVTLTEDLDYGVTNSQVGFNVTLLTTDIVTFTYVMDGSLTNVLTNEYKVAGTIPSGATGTQGSNKVFYNTTQSKYEYYLDSAPPTSVFILLLNGVSLTQNIDFYLSDTNNKRLIFNAGNLKTGDIISIYYEQGTGIDSEITTPTPTMSWTIPNESSTTASTFNVQMAIYGDSTFSDIKFTQSINHIVGVKEYETIIGPLTGLTYGDKVICRINNNKNYTTISGSVFNMNAISDTVTLKIATNAINTY